MGLRIIEAGPNDVDSVAELLDEYRQFYEAESDLPGARAFLEKRIEKNESAVFLALGGANGSEKALGFVQLYPLFSTVSLEPVWNLNDLYVSPSARHSGVGRALIERARELAVATGSRGLIMSAGHDTHGVHELIHAVGFVRDDEFIHYFLPV
jgi:ribosomal protein S18 acetylase RimI-like enzyme